MLAAQSLADLAERFVGTRLPADLGSGSKHGGPCTSWSRKAHGPDPLAVLLTHGWPAFLEYVELRPLLSDPRPAQREAGANVSI